MHNASGGVTLLDEMTKLQLLYHLNIVLPHLTNAFIAEVRVSTVSGASCTVSLAFLERGLWVKNSESLPFEIERTANRDTGGRCYISHRSSCSVTRTHSAVL